MNVEETFPNISFTCKILIYWDHRTSNILFLQFLRSWQCVHFKHQTSPEFSSYQHGLLRVAYLTHRGECEFSLFS